MRAVTVSIILMVISSTCFAGSADHGGNGVRLQFAQARDLAVAYVNSYQDIPFVVPTHVRSWMAANKSALAEDIRLSKHKVVPEVLGHDAITQLSPRADIVLSEPICQQYFANVKLAAALLIHESAHHLGVEDEMLADAIANGVSNAWSYYHPEAGAASCSAATSRESPVFGRTASDASIPLPGVNLICWDEHSNAGFQIDTVRKRIWHIVTFESSSSSVSVSSSTWTTLSDAQFVPTDSAPDTYRIHGSLDTSDGFGWLSKRTFDGRTKWNLQDDGDVLLLTGRYSHSTGVTPTEFSANMRHENFTDVPCRYVPQR